MVDTVDRIKIGTVNDTLSQLRAEALINKLRDVLAEPTQTRGDTLGYVNDEARLNNLRQYSSRDECQHTLQNSRPCPLRGIGRYLGLHSSIDGV